MLQERWLSLPSPLTGALTGTLEEDWQDCAKGQIEEALDQGDSLCSDLSWGVQTVDTDWSFYRISSFHKHHIPTPKHMEREKANSSSGGTGLIFPQRCEDTFLPASTTFPILFCLSLPTGHHLLNTDGVERNKNRTS